MRASTTLPSRSSSLLTSALLGTSLLTSIGCSSLCTTRSQVFEGYSDDQLWTAMVASATTPVYDDWRVLDNHVHSDPTTHRIEISRVLKRTLVNPEAPPLEQEREWKFQVVLTHDPELNAPLIDFTARQLAVPAYVWSESDRFFLQMRTLLGAPAATIESTSAQEPTTPAQP